MRSLLERQRISNEAVGTLDAIAVAAEDTDANAQVFQVRDGVLADRQSFYLENAARRDEGEVAEEFVLQYYASALCGAAAGDRAAPRSRTTRRLPRRSAERRGAPVEVRHAERGDKRRIFELAERNARFALDQDRLRSERRRSQRIEALDGLQQALGMETIPMRIECFDISNLMGDHTVASMVVFEGGAPKKSDYRRFGIRGSVQDDFAAMGEVLSRRMAQFVAQRERSPHDPEFDESFASVPALIVIDGGKGQLSAGLSELGPFRDLGVTVVSLAKRVEEVFLPGRASAAHAPARHARAAAAPARARRGAPLRDRVPPRPPRPRDDPLDPRRAARRRARRASAASCTTSAPPSASSRRAARSSRRCRGCPARSRARSTNTCTRCADKTDKGACEDFVVITGFSGAGKSQAMATFEDAGYFCVDNLPPEMIGSLAELFGHEGSKVERAAVASDVRGGEYFDGLVAGASTTSRRAASPTALLYLEAGEETLINRFKETRRRHPLANGGSVERAIALERVAAGAAQGARRRLDRHQRPVGRRGCARWSPTRCSRPAGWAGSR